MTTVKQLPNRAAIERRRRTGRVMLGAYLSHMGERADLNEYTIDALADLLHAINGYGQDVPDVVRIALMRFTEERAGRES